jgi:hypothetical protein
MAQLRHMAWLLDPSGKLVLDLSIVDQSGPFSFWSWAWAFEDIFLGYDFSLWFRLVWALGWTWVAP